MSSPGPTSSTLLGTLSPSPRRYQCSPPEPVTERRVSGRSRPLLVPPLSGSTSSTTRSPPVAIATFASGHLDHHSRITSGSELAPVHPFGVRGCLPTFSQSARAQLQCVPVLVIRGVWHGKTR